MKVSVVVPVYNPGSSINRCIDSLLRQTLPSSEFEVVFVDDGATDETPALLDRLAEEHGHIRVLHEENSGWAGKPRNIGVEAARGEYVQFLDQDDVLGDDALRRLYDMGARNDADIVIGKVTSDFRGVPHGVFRENVERCTVRDFPLIDSLTPHKMFRRRFLLDNGIAFPEGKRRLEDQLYMVQSYLAAKSVSIVGDYPCYFYLRREDKKNAGSARIEPEGYYTNLREVLDALDAGTEPGEFRNTLLRRFLRSEVLSRVNSATALKWPVAYRRQLFREVRKIIKERFPEEVGDGLETVPRLRYLLATRGRLDDMTEFSERARGVVAGATVTDARWQGGALRLGIRADLRYAEGGALELVESDGRLLFDPRITDGLVEPEHTDVRTDVQTIRGAVVVQDAESRIQWHVPAQLTATTEPVNGTDRRRVVVTLTAAIDPSVAAGGSRLTPAVWDVYVTLHAFGVPHKMRATLPARAAALREVSVPGSPKLTAAPVATASGHLAIDVSDRRRTVGERVARRAKGAATLLPPRVRHRLARWYRRRR
jgi:glycosyltransferase involved in cell wall biosynthesis